MNRILLPLLISLSAPPVGAAPTQWTAAAATGYPLATTAALKMIDADDHAAAVTQTAKPWFGAGILLPESDVMLNNEMADSRRDGNVGGI